MTYVAHYVSVCFVSFCDCGYVCVVCVYVCERGMYCYGMTNYVLFVLCFWNIREGYSGDHDHRSHMYE